MDIARRHPLSQTEIAKKGKVTIPSPFSTGQKPRMSLRLYLVFASSFFSSAFSGIGAASLAGSLGVAGGAGSAGAAGAGGGGGGAGSSCLPQPIIVRDKAKSVITDNETNFFPILNSPPFPSHVANFLLLMIRYRTTHLDIQARRRYDPGPCFCY
jgi:hypothetical protein